MSARIHPTAIVSKDAELGDGVEVGPFAIVGEGCISARMRHRGASDTRAERHARVDVKVGSGASSAAIRRT